MPDRDNCPTKASSYFYETLVPRDPWLNLAYRKWVLEKSWTDPEFAQEQWIMCSRDLLYFIAVYGWLLEPRDKAPWQPSRHFGHAREIPFLLRKYQETTMLRLQASFGVRDSIMLKSREMGATWMVLYLIAWSWTFHSQTHYGLMSKDEDSMDSAKNPDSLMSKVDFITEHLPCFLKPRYSHSGTDHVIANLDNGSTITGWACTGSVGTGGRKRAVFCDEAHFFPASSEVGSFASLQHTTPCRLIVSTPNPERGQNGVFYDTWQNTDAEVDRFELHWSIDEDKAAGMYRADGNQIEFLEMKDGTPEEATVAYDYPADYKFVRDGKMRSPYYDYECKRPMADEQTIAAELDMDFGGATTKFFAPHVIFKARQECRDPNGQVMLRQVEGEWIPELTKSTQENPIELWMSPYNGLRFHDTGRLIIPEGRKYAMGVDVAYGVGGNYASQSALSIMDCMTSTQVAEFATLKMPPEDWAIFCAIVGQVFNYALLCVEATGVGKFFVGKIIQIGYRNLWYRKASVDDIRQGETRKVGFDNKDAGAILLGELKLAFQQGTYKPRSLRAVDECAKYHLNSNSELKHPLVGKGKNNTAQKSHGDCAIAMAASWFAIHSDPEVEEAAKKPDEYPEGSFGHRQKMAAKQNRPRTPSWWDPGYAQIGG